MLHYFRMLSFSITDQRNFLVYNVMLELDKLLYRKRSPPSKHYVIILVHGLVNYWLTVGRSGTNRNYGADQRLVRNSHEPT
jgi:hypothetical protein